MRRLLRRLAVMLLRMSRRSCRCRKCELRRAAAVERWKAKTLTYRDLAEPPAETHPARPDGPTSAAPQQVEPVAPEPGEHVDVDEDQGDEATEPQTDQVVHGPTVDPKPRRPWTPAPWQAAALQDFYDARLARDRVREAFCKGHENEAAEFDELYPPPRLWDFYRDHRARWEADEAGAA